MTEQGNTRIRIDVGYDGTDFSGWAKQPGLRTVQAELEHAVHQMFGFQGEPASLVVAGRTDAGVHAFAQVAHLDLTPERVARLARLRGMDGLPDPDIARSLRRRMNGVLGAEADAWVHAARVVPPEFNARFSALSRRYRYRIADPLAHRDPIVRRTTLWYNRRLDVEVMDQVAARLVGLHDYASYCRPRPGATTIRNLTDFRWHRDTDGVLIGELRADAFCHSMVRSLVGACIATSHGRLGPGQAEELFDRPTTGDEYAVAPANGLTLVGVDYPEDALLAARAEITRQRRVDTTPFPGETVPEPPRIDRGPGGA